MPWSMRSICAAYTSMQRSSHSLCSASVQAGCVGSRSVSAQALVEDAGVDQPLQPRLAQLVPAGVEAALVPGDVLVVRMQRPVRRGVGHVLEEGLVRVLVRMLRGCSRTAWSLIASV